MCGYDQDPEYGNARKPNTKGKARFFSKIELQYFSDSRSEVNPLLVKLSYDKQSIT